MHIDLQMTIIRPSPSLLGRKAVSTVCCLLLLGPTLTAAQTWVAESIYNTLILYDAASLNEAQLWAWRNSTVFTNAVPLVSNQVYSKPETWADYYSQVDDVRQTTGWLTRASSNADNPFCFQPESATLGESLASLSTKIQADFGAVLSTLFSAVNDSNNSDPEVQELLNNWVSHGQSMLSDVTAEQSLALSFVVPVSNSSVQTTTMRLELEAGTLPSTAPADTVLIDVKPQPFVKSIYSIDTKELNMEIYSLSGLSEKLPQDHSEGPLANVKGPLPLDTSEFEPQPPTATFSTCNAPSSSTPSDEPTSNGFGLSYSVYSLAVSLAVASIISVGLKAT